MIFSIDHMTFEMSRDMLVALATCVTALIGVIYGCYCRWYRGKALSDMTFTIFLAFFVSMGTILMDMVGILVDETKFWIAGLIISSIGGVFVLISKLVFTRLRYRVKEHSNF